MALSLVLFKRGGKNAGLSDITELFKIQWAVQLNDCPKLIGKTLNRRVLFKYRMSEWHHYQWRRGDKRRFLLEHSQQKKLKQKRRIIPIAFFFF